MNRSTKLKPLAPRPAVDQNCQQNMGYSSCPSVPADGRGSVNRNAFVGAHLGLHASPLEAVTSMDPKDYVWGGGNYNASFYGCPSAFTGAQPCYYPSAAEYPVSYGKAINADLRGHTYRNSACIASRIALYVYGLRSCISASHQAIPLLHCRVCKSFPVCSGHTAYRTVRS